MQTRTIDRLLLGGIFLLLVTFAGVLGKSLDDRVAKEGETAPAFTVRTDAGKTLSATDFGGKLLLVNFWATWCQPCVEEVPTLDRLQRRFADQGVVVLGISVDENATAYRQFLTRNPVSFQTMRQTDQKINAEYGTFRYPETYIIDRSGKIVKKIVGEEKWDDERVVNYVQSLL